MKRLAILFTAVTAFGVSLLSACKNDNEEDLNPQPQQQQCNTGNVTYAANVSAILRTNCYSCHNTQVATNGVILDTYAGVKRQADNGNLIGVITHAPGFPPMPQGGAKLSDCNIETIRKWIESGAPNN